MTLMCVAILAQLALTSATSPTSCPAGICAAGELGSSDDTQVLLQRQKKVEITGHSDKPIESFSFKVKAADFENSMTFVAVIKDGNDIKGEGDLLCFVGGVLQGVQGKPQVLPPHGLGGAYGGKPVYSLMTYGHGGQQPDDGKELTFKYLTKDGHLVDLQSAAQTFKSDGTVGNHKHPLVLTRANAAPAPAARTCADASQADMNAFLATFGAGYNGITCAQFKGWGQCSIVKGKCDKTCGECQ